jgi:hypothetical protein
MAAWRRRALELLPELRKEIETEAFSPHALFFELLPFVRNAHAQDDDDALRRAYSFAQWCHHQRRGSDLPNAVGVSFYEHLFDDWSHHRAVVPWLSPTVRRDIWPLWQRRLDAQQLNELQRLIENPGDERWRELRA